MKASIAGRIRNTNLPKTKALLPLFEAVINAFQAIEEAGGRGTPSASLPSGKAASTEASRGRSRPSR